MGPVWTRTSGGWSGTLIAMEVDPYSALYINGSGAVDVWVATTTGIYKVSDIFGTPSAALQFTFRVSLAALEGKVLQMSFGVQNWGICVSQYDSAGNRGTWVTFTTDGVNWSAEVAITTFYHSGAGFGHSPGLYVSNKTAGLAYTSAFTATALEPPHAGYKSTDFGANWSLITNPDLSEIMGAGGQILAPYASNPNEDIVFFGGWDAAANEYQFFRANGAVQTEITQSFGGQSYGLSGRDGGKWQISDYPLESGYMTAVLRSAVVAKVGLWRSYDAGTTWENFITPIAASQWFRCGISGADKNTLYLCGETGKLDYSTDFGDTTLDMSGNIPADWPGVGTFYFLIGG